MQRCWILIYIVIMIVAINGHVQNLHVDVIPMQTRFASTQDVHVILKYNNLGNDTMSILKWFVPQKTLTDPLFEVTRDGKRVEYVGPLIKRRAPTAEDVISLTPGMTLTVVVPLSTVYNMTQSGNYVVKYKMNANLVVFTPNDILKRTLMPSNNNKDFLLQSTPIVIFTAGRRNLLIERAIRRNAQTRAYVPEYSGCSSNEIKKINSAVVEAENYANSAVEYLNSQTSATPRYTTWFGSYLRSRQVKVKTHLENILNALSTEVLSFDCTCPDGQSTTFAYVYSSEHYTIYLCNQFWPAVTTGTDSKAGTIIHELAHFEILVGTDDHGYGKTFCKDLAMSDPAMAIMNSDNIQYFTENNPTLN